MVYPCPDPVFAARPNRPTQRTFRVGTCIAVESKDVPMAANRTTFEKLQRDRAKKAKAAAKRAKRHGHAVAAPVDTGPEPQATATDEWNLGESDKPLSAGELLTLVEQLQNQFDSKAISFEEYEERKADLLARLPVD